jgi:calmodulin
MGRKFDECGDSTDEIVDAFRAFDGSGDGVISVTELKHILTTMGEKMSEKEVQMLLDECVIDDGKINYQSLANMLFNPTAA